MQRFLRARERGKLCCRMRTWLGGLVACLVVVDRERVSTLNVERSTTWLGQTDSRGHPYKRQDCLVGPQRLVCNFEHTIRIVGPGHVGSVSDNMGRTGHRAASRHESPVAEGGHALWRRGSARSCNTHTWFTDELVQRSPSQRGIQRTRRSRAFYRVPNMGAVCLSM